MLHQQCTHPEDAFIVLMQSVIFYVCHANPSVAADMATGQCFIAAMKDRRKAPSIMGASAQHSTAQYSTAQHSAAQHSAAQHFIAHCSAGQQGTAQHGTAQFAAARSIAFQLDGMHALPGQPGILLVFSLN